MEQARILRVVVASPGDVAAERDAVVRAAEEVNRNIGRTRGLRLEVYRWETDAHPGFSPLGPQGIIDGKLGIESCDLLIAMFWKRFGTPTLDGQTGTEHEFNIAYEAWKEKRRPEIMMYFRRQPEGLEDEQSLLVLAFQKRFPREGFCWSYDCDGKFEALVRNHLAQFVLSLEPLSGLNALHSLPPPPADFTGREAELAELRTALEQGGVHISGLQGQGGVGKTALALKLAEELRPTYPDAQIYLDLRGVSKKEAGDRPLTAAEALAYVIRACHPEAQLPQSEAELRGIYLNLLHGKRALLLLDNACEKAQVEPLIPPAGSALLVTSRTHFTLPGLRSKNIETLRPSDAEKLLLEIEQRINGEASSIARLCGYLPLALRLAGSALAEHPDLPPSDYARRLGKERLKVLTESKASIGLSYALLDVQMQQRWRMLGVFPDTFHTSAAARVWQMELDATQDALSQLRQYSMLEWNDTARRYRLHDLMRDFARGRGQEAGEEDLAARRHATHYVNVLAQADDLYRKGGESIKPGLALFDLEWGNIRAGQAWVAANSERDDEAAELCSRYPDAGTYCLDLRLHPRQQIRWREAALAAARRLKDRSTEAAHLGNLGLAYYDLGEYLRAIEYHEQSLAIAHDIGDWRGGGNAVGNLGLAYYDLGEYRRAIQYHEQNLAIAREIRDRRGEGNALGNLGTAYHDLGEYRRAIEYYENQLSIARDIDQRLGEGNANGGLGNAYYSLGEYRRAIDYHQQQLVIAREIGDRYGEGSAQWNISLAMDKLGERQKAVESAEAALKTYEQIEDPNAAKVRKQIEEWKGKSEVPGTRCQNRVIG